MSSRARTRGWTAAVVACASTGAGLLALSPAAQALPPNTAPGEQVAFSTFSSGPPINVEVLDTSAVDTQVSSHSDFSLGVAYDAAGDLFYDTGSTLLELTPGSTTPITVATNLPSTSQFLTIDPAGNIYVSDFIDGITKIATGTHTTSVLGTGMPFTGLAIDSSGDLYAVSSSFGATSSTLYRFTGGSGAPAVVATTTGRWFGVAVAPDDTLYVSDPDASDVLHLDAGGSILGAIPTAAQSYGVAVAPSGNIYLSDGLHLVEYPAGSSTPTTLATLDRYVFTPAVVPAHPSTPPPAAPVGTDTTSATTPTVRPRVTQARSHVHRRRLTVRAEDLEPGETYKIRLHGVILKRGTVSSDGVVTARVHLPPRLHGWHRVKVIGSVTGRLTKRLFIPAHRG